MYSMYTYLKNITLKEANFHYLSEDFYNDIILIFTNKSKKDVLKKALFDTKKKLHHMHN